MTTKRRILLVEDQELMRIGTQRLIRSAGYSCQAVESGEQALEALEQQLPDLILLDVDLPGISGREVCRRIRNDPRFEGVYVVMLSSTKVASEDQSQGLEDGADAYIGRPIPNRELLARIRAMLRLKASEEELLSNKAQQLEQRRNETIGTMAGGMAHDFNNLLAIIMGNVELAKDVIKRDPLAVEALDNALEACGWAANVTRKFMTLSHSNSLIFSVVRIDDLIRRSVRQLDCPDAIHVDIQVADDLPETRVDIEQLQMALNCLLANALEAMPRGGRLRVRAQLAGPKATADKADPATIDILIEDSGHGISRSHLPKIFDPYFSTKELGSQKGMGLGLATANAIIVQHGGSVELETEVDRGTTVTVRLPLNANPASSN